MSSPDKSLEARVTEYSPQYFWGGEKNFSVFEVFNKDHKTILKHTYFHPGQKLNWYGFGKIEWEANNEIKFSIKSKPILYLYINMPENHD